MKQLILITLSVFTLMFSSARSVRAQVAIAFPAIDLSTENTTPTETPKVVDSPSQSDANKPSTSNRVNVVTFNVANNDRKASTPIKKAPSKAVANNAPVANGRLIAMSPDEMFDGGANSLVAKAVGHAEGTRTVDGGKTWAYQGHVDPGNGVWNRGSFSYQHEADSPEDADVRQLNRLRRQYEVIEQKAIAQGLSLDLQEQLNGIDLANQAPLAALDRGGYIDRLRQAYDQGLRGSEAVLHARTYSFINPNTNQWDAPGLGNNEYSISRDQERRLNAISAAVEAHQETTSRQN